MSKNLSLVLPLTIVLILFIGCQKELNFTYFNTNTPGSNSGTAHFRFSGGTGSCSSATIGGSYNAGTALSNKNTVTLQVIVDSIGDYTIATANINGIIFSATGNFSSTGNQSIILKGTGTPSAHGKFNFVPGAYGCIFPINFTSSGTTIAQFTLNGAPDSCTTPVINGNYVVGKVVGADNTIDIKATVTTPGDYSVTTNTVNGLLFSGAGTFSATGQQIITLKAVGTPAKSGTFVFTPGTNGCKFSLAVTE